MATKILIKDGKAHAVYDDRLRPLFESLGLMKVSRASSVEFNAVSGDWVAKAPDGMVIAWGKKRDEVIQAEVEWLEARL